MLCVMGDIVHRYPGFLPVSAVSMAEHDGFGGVLGRIYHPFIFRLPSMVERDILVIHIFSKLGIEYSGATVGFDKTHAI